jgi:hypothetical protein
VAKSRGEDNKLCWLKFDDEQFEVYQQDHEKIWVFSPLNLDYIDNTIIPRIWESVLPRQLTHDLPPEFYPQYCPLFRLGADD